MPSAATPSIAPTRSSGISANTCSTIRPSRTENAGARASARIGLFRSCVSVREAAELGADRNHQHRAAGIGQIFGVMAKGRRQRADLARPVRADRNLVGRLPEQEAGAAERNQKTDSGHVKGSQSSSTCDKSILDSSLFAPTMRARFPKVISGKLRGG